jgi:hypothetical protein
MARDHGVRFSNGAPFVASPFQAFIGDSRPKFFQGRRRRKRGYQLVRRETLRRKPSCGIGKERGAEPNDDGNQRE